MKYLLQLIALGMLILLSSCGDYYTFDETGARSDNVSMTVAQDTAWLMVGDRMPLQVTFTPHASDSLPVFWMPVSNEAVVCATTRNDTVTALRTGEMDFVAVGVSGTQRDTCHVIVIDRWEERDFSHEQRSDMVVYASITVDGQPLDYATQTVAAFARGTLIGFAVPREAYGIPYALLRLWNSADEEVGVVTFYCYDRARRKLYRAEERPEFTALSALGTLSQLYQITF